MDETINWSDFEKVNIRVGTILSVDVLQKAKKPAFVLEIDFGEWGIKTSSAQITVHYQTNDLIGKQIIAVVNFPPKRIAGIKSECLVLGIYEENGEVVLLSADKKVKNGLKIG
ncbi:MULTISPECIES: tRNA-binding protein [unclassified Lentimicrobium]|uniref:tRNA-binding protein n=1 Tax=unclassified Lentimicrobium TaxID=2677434 RepID=UPI00155376E5|nr:MULTISPECIES: tRNA-binding protein [unclassified Lentimicrobium]NPD45437.1 tRNA-binding protein [Lentimicrobium sp. S6]NPD83799.1 tRNA-binding protein [Lentimicrobium sp. L6]